MTSGEYDLLLSIQSPSSSINAVGDVEKSWTTVLTPWVSKKNLRGQELSEARQLHAEVTVRFETHWCAELSALARTGAGYRLVEVQGSIVYDLLEVLEIPGGRPERIQLLAKRRAD